MPGVSIFMSSYNHAKYLSEAVESVLAQTYRDFELIIVDDASTDESWSILQEYKDERIKAIRNEVNRNDKVMMNRVISEMAAGEYIAVHHSDNAWELDKLEKQVAFLDAHPQVGAVFTRVLSIDENGSPLRDRTNFFYSIYDQPNRTRFEWLRHFFYRGNALCHPSVLVRRKCYEECGLYRLGLQKIPDLDMWVRLCQRHEIHVLPEKLTRYRVPAHRGRTSGVSPVSAATYQYELLHVLEHYRKIELEDLTRVFPQAVHYAKSVDHDTEYALARVALENANLPVVRFFGLNLLFNALNDPVRSKQLEKLYGFTSREFYALRSKQDFKPGVNRKKVLASDTPLPSRIAMILARVIIKLKTKQIRLISTSGYFDGDWYLAHYPDVAASGIDPAAHYLLYGGFEGRDPGPRFSSREYLARNPEAARKGINPLLDHIRQNNSD